jgi:hypothetical protein
VCTVVDGTGSLGSRAAACSSAAGDHNGPGWTQGAEREERVGGRVSTAH